MKKTCITLLLNTNKFSFDIILMKCKTTPVNTVVAARFVLKKKLNKGIQQADTVTFCHSSLYLKNTKKRNGLQSICDLKSFVSIT